MSNGEKLVKIMKEAGKSPDSDRVGIVMGDVLSTTPLSIKVDKLILSETFLMLSPFCIEKKITLEHTHQYEDVNSAAHTHSYNDVVLAKHKHVAAGADTSEVGSDTAAQKTTGSSSTTSENKTTGSSSTTVQLWRGIQAGDSVRMLKCAGGQLYYVLERCE